MGKEQATGSELWVLYEQIQIPSLRSRPQAIPKRAETHAGRAGGKSGRGYVLHQYVGEQPKIPQSGNAVRFGGSAWRVPFRTCRRDGKRVDGGLFKNPPGIGVSGGSRKPTPGNGMAAPVGICAPFPRKPHGPRKAGGQFPHASLPDQSEPKRDCGGSSSRPKAQPPDGNDCFAAHIRKTGCPRPNRRVLHRCSPCALPVRVGATPSL